MKVNAFIFARGGSKGIPGKNIKQLAGKPLIAHSIEQALKSELIDKVYVSTDCDKISQVAIEYGANVIQRPESLAQDDSPEWLAWIHAVEYVKRCSGNFDVFISLPSTSPMRNSEDIDRVLNALTGCNDIVVTTTAAARSPHFNMVKKNSEGFCEILLPLEGISRRQDVPEVFDLTTVAYATTPEYILRASGVFSGDVTSVFIPPERAIDIDTMLDFQFAEFLMSKKQKVEA